LNWSVGRHFCLGRMFAVMECEELVRAMTDRWSSLRRLAPGKPPSSYDPAEYKHLDIVGVCDD
jgi:cytochrome P450